MAIVSRSAAGGLHSNGVDTAPQVPCAGEREKEGHGMAYCVHFNILSCSSALFLSSALVNGSYFESVESYLATAGG